MKPVMVKAQGHVITDKTKVTAAYFCLAINGNGFKATTLDDKTTIQLPYSAIKELVAEYEEANR